MPATVPAIAALKTVSKSVQPGSRCKTRRLKSEIRMPKSELIKPDVHAPTPGFRSSGFFRNSVSSRGLRARALQEKCITPALSLSIVS